MSYIVPNVKALAALTPGQAADGWGNAPEVIDDDYPLQQPNGHGTGVACVVGATSDKIGVAPQTNLYLIKAVNSFIRQRDGMTERGPVRASFPGWIDSFTRIYNAWLPADQNGEGIDPHRSVINFSICKLAEPNFKWSILAYMIIDARNNEMLYHVM